MKIVVASPLGPMSCLSILSWPNNGSIYEFYLEEQDLNPIKKLLVTPMIFMPLLHLVTMSCQTNHVSQLGIMILIFLL